MKLFDEPATVVVTGAGRGIGAEIVRVLAREGANVVFTYRRSASQARALEEQVAADGGSATGYQVEITDETAVRALFQQVLRTRGRLDVVINNAGTHRDGYLATMSLQQFREVFEVNTFGLFLCCREAMRIMIPARDGCIVNISSALARSGSAGQANYCASKAAVLALTRCLAIEGASYGIRVCSVSPGLVETDMSRSVAKALMDQKTSNIPMARKATPEEIATVTVMIASNVCSYLTGSDVVVDGGALAGTKIPERVLTGRRGRLSVDR